MTYFYLIFKSLGYTIVISYIIFKLLLRDVASRCNFHVVFKPLAAYLMLHRAEFLCLQGSPITASDTPVATYLKGKVFVYILYVVDIMFYRPSPCYVVVRTVLVRFLNWITIFMVIQCLTITIDGVCHWIHRHIVIAKSLFHHNLVINRLWWNNDLAMIMWPWIQWHIIPGFLCKWYNDTNWNDLKCSDCRQLWVFQRVIQRFTPLST